MFIFDSSLEIDAEQAFRNITFLNCTYANILQDIFKILVRRKHGESQCIEFMIMLFMFP